MNSNFRVDTIAPNTTGNYNFCKTAFAIFYILAPRPVWVWTGGRNRTQLYEMTARVLFMPRRISVGIQTAALQSRQQGNGNQCVQRAYGGVTSDFNPVNTSKNPCRTAEREESTLASNMAELTKHRLPHLYS